jgi:predicted glycosyltransferase
MGFVFYSGETASLGRTSRLLGIANALRQQVAETRSTFLVPATGGDTCLIESEGYSWHRLSDERNRLREIWAEAMREVDSPSVLVQDTTLRRPLFRLAQEEGSRQVLVIRERTDLLHFLHQFKAEIAELDLVVFPHTEGELDLLPLDWLPDSKVLYCGTLLRRSRQEAEVATVRKQYGLRPDEFTIVVTNGGGNGAVQLEDDFWSVVQEALKQADPDLPTFHVVCVTGPLSRETVEPVTFRHGRMTLRAFEPRLFDLFAAARLVIGRGGYNTVHELLESGIPALCIPIPDGRSAENQAARIRQAAGLLGSQIHLSDLDPTRLAEEIQQISRQPRWSYVPDIAPDVIAANKRALVHRLLQLTQQ